MRALKKLAGLLVLYAVIIFGIFVIQFKGDSLIRKNFGGIGVTLSQREENGAAVFKNEFKVSFKGISFFAKENSPVTFLQDQKERTARLISFFEQDENSFLLNFSDGISLAFSLEGEGENAVFWMRAKMPESVQSVSVNFFATEGFSILEQKEKSAIFASKKKGSQDSHLLFAPKLQERICVLQNDLNSAYYALTSKEEKFALSEIENYSLAKIEVYESTLDDLKKNLVSQFLEEVQNKEDFSSSLDEKTAVAFLAEMAALGRYNEGINAIPRDFANSEKRTFLSAPFLGGLEKTLPSLLRQTQTFDQEIARAVQNRTLEVFAIPFIAQYMYSYGNRGNVASLVRMPALLTELNLSVESAAGIIFSYMYFRKQASSLAAPLEPVLELCVQKIIDNSFVKNDTLVLKENGSPLSIFSAAFSASALVSYGKEIANEQIEKFGYFVANSYFAENRVLDLSVVAQAYPFFAVENDFYPHFALLNTREPANIWAFTSAQRIVYIASSNSIQMDFPVRLSHYVFVAGVPQFQRLQIYAMDFREDPQFESYNSSGYLYDANTQTLFLKSLHRERRETVRMF